MRRSVQGFLLAFCLACRPGVNYGDPASPRYADSARIVPASSTRDILRVVSFNIEYSRHARQAAQILSSVPTLRDADIILLQEMTAPATRFLADSLRMRYVYYPAIYNRVVRRDIGNAVLSRWPIADDSKLILPSRSRYAKTQRIATAATVRIRDQSVRVYSTHFGTPADLGWKGRVAQLAGILDDAAKYQVVIIGGDMNSRDIGRVAREAGYVWPTDTIPKSNDFGRFDHFFVRGLGLAAAGTHRISRSISDHSPIWVVACLSKESTVAFCGSRSTSSHRSTRR